MDAKISHGVEVEETCTYRCKECWEDVTCCEICKKDFDPDDDLYCLIVNDFRVHYCAKCYNLNKDECD